MKKVLYGTTALAAAGLLLTIPGQASAQTAERLQLGVSGYFQQFGAYMGGHELENFNGNKNFDVSRFDQKHNSEIHFKGSFKMDNGITVGVQVELEANTEGDQIDESFMFLETAEWGRLEIGDLNNAAWRMQVTAPHGGIAHNAAMLTSMPDQGLVILPTGFRGDDTTLTGTRLRFDDNDSGKFNYYTPRFAGFQIGLSYIPRFEGGGDNNNSITAAGNNRLAPPALAGGNTNRTIKDGYAGAINYTEQFGDIGVKASLGYMAGDVPSAGRSAGRGGSNNLQAASGGLLLTFGGFEFGGSYTWASGDMADGAFNPATGNGESYNGYSYDAGVAYTFGPYKIGLAYLKGVSEGLRDTSSKKYADYLVLSGTYRIGPGVNLVGGIYGWDLNAEDDRAAITNTNAAQSIEESKGVGGAIGFVLSF